MTRRWWRPRRSPATLRFDAMADHVELTVEPGGLPIHLSPEDIDDLVKHLLIAKSEVGT